MDGLGVVVIGRNEGERLVRSLESVLDAAETVVYVDSGSADGSQRAARALGAEVVELDPSRPFTAARARNAGFARLRELAPGTAFVQFVDGDCEVDPRWLLAGFAFLQAHDDVALVCGMLEERHPDASIYNKLCALEWRLPPGDTRTTGGIFMARAAAFEALNGLDEGLIAGEEPDLCIRLRKAEWRLHRLPETMAVHDAAMQSFRQWWTRCVRNGHAAAEGWMRHGDPPERYKAKEVGSSVAWGGLVPLMFIGCAAYGFLAPLAWLGAVGLGGAAVAQGWRIQVGRRKRGDAPKEARLYAVFCMLAKIPETLGIAQFFLNRLRNRQSELIEYK